LSRSSFLEQLGSVIEFDELFAGMKKHRIATGDEW
jgi:hypothetical protein